MAYKISNTVDWVGKIDWELRHFHGEELSTFRGSSYNAYLIRDEKTVLVDTVWGPYDKEFVKKLAQEIDLNEIDYIISTHGETDHSGALPELMRHIPDTPIYCSQMGVKSLTGQYHADWNLVPMKTGDTLDIGKQKITFVEARMLHWPDSMMFFLEGDNILFSNDAFGQHYASEMMFNDLVDQGELYFEAMKYYANIILPFSKILEMKLKEIDNMNLPVEMICPSHGVIWRDNPMQIVETYNKWCRNYQEHQVTVVYDSMWKGTYHLANAIAEGARKADPSLVVKVIYLGKSDQNDALTEVFKSKAIALGSPTVNKGILSKIASFLSLATEYNFQDKKAVAFGCYGWSGESPKLLADALTKANFEMVAEPLRAEWQPDEKALDEAFKLGETLANACK